jgi:murein DD-endopeptidase MepM/ murein hydrolase activator NlpD
MNRRPPLLLTAFALVMSAAPGGLAEPGEPAAIAPAAPAAPPALAPLTAPSALAPSDGSELDRMLARLDEEERSLRADLDRVGPELDVTRRRIVARARAYYRHVRAGFLPAGGGFDALVDYAASVERTRRALERDRAAESELIQREGEIRDKLARMRVARAPLEVQREAMNRARMALQQADERNAAFARAFESSVRPPDYMAIYGADTGPRAMDAKEGFRTLKGRLPMPITGRAEVRRVMRRGANGPGIELSAVAGATARSVAPGRVVYADRHDEYGLTVILDHGDSYYSVYADLGTAEVRLGDVIAQGSRIGTPGSGEAPGRPAVLYFELRQASVTMDPAPWLGL